MLLGKTLVPSSSHCQLWWDGGFPLSPVGLVQSMALHGGRRLLAGLRPLCPAKLAVLATFLPRQHLGDWATASGHTNFYLLCFFNTAKKGKGKD